MNTSEIKTPQSNEGCLAIFITLDKCSSTDPLIWGRP